MAKLYYAFTNKTIDAGTKCAVYLFFGSLTEADKAQSLRCHIHDPKFSLDYYLDPIQLGSMTVFEPDSTWLENRYFPRDAKIGTLEIVFPDQLSGGTFTMDFQLQNNVEDSLDAPTSLPNILDVRDYLLNCSTLNPKDNVSLNVINNFLTTSITITSPQGPIIENAYWAASDDIKYRQTSSTRKSSTVHSNEMIFAHVHTRGLYGGSIYNQEGDQKSGSPVSVKDNTCILACPANKFSLSGNKIKLSIATDEKMTQGKIRLPELTFDSNDIKIDAPQTMSVNVLTEAKTEDWEKISDATYRVDFRPGENSYKGDFGFSWFRVGDTGTKFQTHINDSSFLENLGYHYDPDGSVAQDPNNGYNGDFKVSPEMIERHIKDYQRILLPNMRKGSGTNVVDELQDSVYLVPQMTIRKGISASLDLLVKGKGDAEEFKFVFSNPQAGKGGFLSVSPQSAGSLDSSSKVTIKCIKEFSKSVNLDVFAYAKKGDDATKRLCGSLRILPNDILHQRNVDVLLMNICHGQTTSDGSTTLIKGEEKTQLTEENLKKFYDQALVNLNVKKVDINIDNMNDPLMKKCEAEFLDTPRTIYDSFLAVDNNETLELNDDSDEFDRLFFFIADNYLADHPSINKNCFVIVAIPLGGDLNGYSYSGKRFTFCFSNCNLATPTHELGHALGLPHTFTGCTSLAKYVYQYASTDNIMDYSHQYDVERQSFFYWQWKSMNAFME